MNTDCTLAFLVARTDVSFMMQTIPHLVRTCRFLFKKRLLFVDTAPLGREYLTRPGIGTLDELYTCCQSLVQDGVIDEVIDIPYSAPERKQGYRKHFAPPLFHTHDCRGYPIWGSIFPLETVKTRYLVHFDSDMLLYQHPDYSWIEAGIEYLQKYPDIASILPLSGPPTSGGELLQQSQEQEPYIRDERGFYSFKTFTSRVFLIDIPKFEQLLPLQFDLPLKSRIRDLVYKKSCLRPWEEMVGQVLKKSSYVRVDLDSARAWTLHPSVRGTQFLEALPRLIQQIEAGQYPPEQAGYYDLELDCWTEQDRDQPSEMNSYA